MKRLFVIGFATLSFMQLQATCGYNDYGGEVKCCRGSDFQVLNAGNSSCVWQANKYQFTIRSIHLRNKDTGELVLLSDTPKTFNAADAGIGASMGAFVENAVIPPGTYDAFVPTINNTFTLDTADAGGGVNELVVAKQGGGNVVINLPEFDVDMTVMGGGAMPNCVDGKLPGGAVEDHCKMDGTSFRIFDTQMGNITVREGSKISFNFGFDTGSAIYARFLNGAADGGPQNGRLHVTITATST